MASDFVRQPLLTRLNRGNLIDRLKKVESKTGARVSTHVDDLSEVADEMTAVKFTAIDPNAQVVRMVMSGTNLSDEYGVDANLSGFADDGTPTFYVNAQTGALTGGGGKSMVDENGFSIALQGGYADESAYKFEDSNGVDEGGLYGYDDANNISLLLYTKSIALKQTDISIEAKSGLDASNNKLPASVQIRALSGNQGIGAVGSTMITILDAGDSGGSNSIAINDGAIDADTFIRSENNNNMIHVDAGLNAVGIGGAASSDYTVKITGSLQVTGSIKGAGLIRGDGGTLTIASGSITPTHTFHLVDTEGAAATDDLTTIAVTNGVTGDILVLRPASGARDVVVKDGSPIRCAGDFTMDSGDDTFTCVQSSGVFFELARSNNA